MYGDESRSRLQAKLQAQGNVLYSNNIFSFLTSTDVYVCVGPSVCIYVRYDSWLSEGLKNGC